MTNLVVNGQTIYVHFFNPLDTDPNSPTTCIGITRSSAAGNPLYTAFDIPLGDDPDSQWSAICSAEAIIASENLTYSPTGQNSNSLANAALSAAGLSLPSGVSAYMTLGDDIPLPLTSPTNPIGQLETNLLAQGYYVTQSADVGGSEDATADNIVANNSVSIVDCAELERLNNMQGGSVLAGGLIYVPTAADTSVSTSPDTLSSIATFGESYIYDSSVDWEGSNAAYAAGPILDGTGRVNPMFGAGSLIVVTDDGNFASIAGIKAMGFVWSSM